MNGVYNNPACGKLESKSVDNVILVQMGSNYQITNLISTVSEGA